MAVTEKKNIWFYSSTDGTPPPVRTYQMSASQGIFMPGAPVLIHTTGTLNLAADEAPTLLGYVVGVVDPSTTWPLTAALAVNDEVRVAIARPGDVYGVYLDDAGDNEAAVQLYVGDTPSMTVDGTAGMVGYVTADITATGGTMFRIIDLMYNVNPEKFPIAADPGAVLVVHNGTLQG